MTSADLYTFYNKGFQMFPQALEKQELRDLYNASLVIRNSPTPLCIREEYPNLIYNPMAADSTFSRLLDNTLMHRVLDLVLGENSLLYYYSLLIIPPFSNKPDSDRATSIHTDMDRLIYSNRGEDILKVLCIFPLVDYTSSNGPLEVLPGSQKVNTPIEKDLFEEGKVKLLPSAGSMLLLNPLIWHRSGQNFTHSRRCMLAVMACRSWMKQWLDYPSMYKPEKLGLSEKGKKFMGYYNQPARSWKEYLGK